MPLLKKHARNTSYRRVLADKQSAKEVVWQMKPHEAQESSCMVPNRSSLKRVSKRAW